MVLGTEVQMVRYTQLSVDLCNSKMQETLLQTATAVLVAGDAQRVPVRVLFDSGAQGLISPRILALDGPSKGLSMSAHVLRKWRRCHRKGCRLQPLLMSG